MDSSLPTSAFASRSSGLRLSLRSSSGSGGAEITGGGTDPVFLASFMDGEFPFVDVMKRATPLAVPRFGFDRTVVTFCQWASDGSRQNAIGLEEIMRMLLHPTVDTRFKDWPLAVKSILGF